MTQRRRSPRTLLPGMLIIGLLASTSWVGCATRTVEKRIVDTTTLRVMLRGQTKGGTPVDQGFDHPVTISADRLSNILAVPDIKEMDGKVEVRRPAIALPMLKRISQGVAKALQEADPSQQVVVLAVDRRRNLKLFTRKHLTSFLLFVKDDELFLYFGKSGWEIPKQREDNLPQPHLGEDTDLGRLVGGMYMRSPGRQMLAVEWREDYFRRPIATRRKGTGVQRRTVLMDSAVPEEERRQEALPPGLSARDLRELADLEEARTRGDITQGEYERRRRKVIERAR